MKRLFIAHKSSFALYLIAILSIFGMLTVFSFESNVDRAATIVNMARNVGDACCLTCLFWLLSPRWRWLIGFPIAFISIFSLINLWYFRFWNDILPVSCLTMTENVNGLLINSIKGLIQWSDLTFIVPILIFIIAAKRLSTKSEPKFPSKIKLVGLMLSLVGFLLSQTALSEQNRRYHRNDLGVEMTLAANTLQRLTTEPHLSAAYLRDNGMIAYLCKIVATPAKLRTISKSLSESEMEEIKLFINESKRKFNTEEFAENRFKNIIFIIVESLNAEVIDRKVNNREVTPTLNALVNAEGTIASTLMLSQVQEGCSGDGQLIYNAGLLPLEGVATPLHVVHKIQLQPLASQLGRKAIAAVFAGEANSWKEHQNFEKYGFPIISSAAESVNEVNDIGSDAAMFLRGMRFITEAEEPFVIQFITESMHIPFQDKGVDGFTWIYDDTSLEPTVANYLRMCAYFDFQLGRFIEFLKENGIYDNSILIIASDHSQNIATSSVNRRPDSEIPIVFIATNTGKTKRIEKPTMQIDVFPTMLHIAGADTPEFVGTGTSMLDSINNTDIKTAQGISELILRGNYFGIIRD